MRIYAVLAVLVGIVGLTSYARADYGDETFVEKHFDAGQIQDLEIKDINNHIEILPTDKNTVSVTYFDSENEHYQISVQNGKLTITYDTKQPWYLFWLSWNKKSYTLTVEVPSAMLTGLNASTTNGSVLLKDMEIHGSSVLHSTNGSLTANGVHLDGSLTAKCTNGKISLDDIMATGDVTVSSTNGKLLLNNIKLLKAGSFTSTNGRIDATGLMADSIEMRTTNGAITAEQTAVKTKLSMHSVNGAITGSLQGQAADFTIDSGTVNGKNNLKGLDGSGEKTLDVHTTNGRIEIIFK